jgi:hypothetical protein
MCQTWLSHGLSADMAFCADPAGCYLADRVVTVLFMCLQRMAACAASLSTTRCLAW